MMITLYQSVGTLSFTVNILEGFKSAPYKRIEYLELMSKKTKAYDYGSTFDKYYSEFTISGTKDDIFSLADALGNDVGQCEIMTQGDEYIFGAGIDVDFIFLCNITSQNRPYSQDDFATAEIKLKIQGIGIFDGGINQIKYRDNITAGLPKLNYQTPIKRIISKRENAYDLLEFGQSGTFTDVNTGGDPLKNYILDIPLAQTFDEAARIEKYFHTQRAVPFLMSDISFINLFPDQATENVMMTGLVTNRVGLNDWRLSLKLITNV
jgi:hypothetical protein